MRITLVYFSFNPKILYLEPIAKDYSNKNKNDASEKRTRIILPSYASIVVRLWLSFVAKAEPHTHTSILLITKNVARTFLRPLLRLRT